MTRIIYTQWVGPRRYGDPIGRSSDGVTEVPLPAKMNLNDIFSISADLKIGFYGGNHDDGEDFDGVCSVEMEMKEKRKEEMMEMEMEM